MLIKVTADHIRLGARGLCTTCPVALAIACTIPGSQPWVTDHIEIQRSGRTLRIEMPATVLAFAQAFDRGDDVRPFDFDLPLDPRPADRSAATAA